MSLQVASFSGQASHIGMMAPALTWRSVFRPSSWQAAHR
jgi:hypothetical protein